MTEKPIPAIATRALVMLEQQFMRDRATIICEMADVAGVDLSEGWQLKEGATAFIKPDKKEPNGDTE